MTKKLDWEYQTSGKGEYHATVSRNGQTYRIRAVQDESPSNPFTDGDCNWPIIVRSPDKVHDLTCYEFGEERNFHLSLSMLKNDALVHNQHHIARELGHTNLHALLNDYEDEFDGGNSIAPLPKHCTDADALRCCFNAALADRSMSEVLDTLCKLYRMAGWPAWTQQVTGYSQGDWAEVLVVATAEARAKFGDGDVKDEDLKSTAELYGHWAFGDCYGYIVEKGEPDPEDEDEMLWEELGSCWGFYGSDHHESGLEESALECIPDEEKVDA